MPFKISSKLINEINLEANKQLKATETAKPKEDK